jgi:hypothetical protein
MTPSTFLRGAGAALILAALAASPASADSIAYVKGGDLWLATTNDAPREFQVTATGGYSTVSQADDGTLLATYGTHLRRVDRYGTVLSDIETPVGTTSGSYMTFKGPYDADVSPDGTKAAYGFVKEGFSQTPDGDVYADTSNGAAFTRTDALTSMAEPGFKYSLEWDAPEWIDGGTVLLSNGPGYPSDPIAIATAGSGDAKPWFSDPAQPHPMDATISRSKRVIASVGGPDRLSLKVYRDGDGELLGTVYDCFVYSDDGAGYRYASPTFNADGTKLWWASGKGLDVAPIGDMSATCASGQNAAEILPGASSPDWGPADVPTGRPAAPGGGTGSGSGGSGSGSTGSGGTGAGGSAGGPAVQRPGAVAVAASGARLRTALKSGLTLKVTVPAAGRVSATARLGGKVVGTGRGTAGQAGKLTLRLRFTKAARARLLRARSAKLTVTVVQGTATKTIAVRLAR